MGTHPARWLGVAAAVAATLVVAQAVVWRHDTAPAALRHLSSVASAQEPVGIPPGSVLLVTSEQAFIADKGAGTIGNVDLSNGKEWDLSVQYSTEIYLYPDGSGTRITTVDEVTPATQHDLQVWNEEGNPPLAKGIGVPDPERLLGKDTPGYDVSTLPIDPDRLEAALRPVPNGSRTDEQVMGVVADLLSDYNPSPELRAALFQVLADLPGIRYLGEVSDPLGRTGTGILIPNGPSTQELIFDPTTSAVLATLDYAASGGAARSWRAITSSVVTKAPV